MEFKTRMNYKVGFRENHYDSRLGPCHRMDKGDDPYSPTGSWTPMQIEDTIDAGLWDTARYVWVDKISTATTPLPHVQFTECHHERTKVLDCHSRYECEPVMISWRGGGDQPEIRDLGWSAIVYRKALWHYQPGKLYQPTDAQLRSALEGALLNLWAGRPRRHMNVALALIELRDVKKTLTQFLEFSKFGAQLVKGKLKLPAEMRGLLGVNPGAALSCRKVAEAYLWYTFGVRPTVEDVSRFCREVSKGKLQVRGRKRKPLLVGRTYANGFRCEPRDTPDKSIFEQMIEVKNVNWEHYLSSWSSPVIHCDPWVPPDSWPSYSITRYSGKVFAKVAKNGEWTWKHFPSSFNWSCPLGRTGWELVPFSFVLDWFVDVGKSIQRLDDLSWVATTRFAFEEPWVSLRKETIHYAPKFDARVHTNIQESRVWKSESGSWVASATVSKTATTSWTYAPERSIVTYDRGPASSFGLSYASLWRGLIPEWQGQLKAYQISSGMALLESIFHLL